MNLRLTLILLPSVSLGTARKNFPRNGKRKKPFFIRKELSAKRKEPFAIRKELSAKKKEPFAIRKEPPAKRKEPFALGKELPAERKEPFPAGKELPAKGKEPFPAQARLFRAPACLSSVPVLRRGRQESLTFSQALQRAGMPALLPKAERLTFPQAARTAAGLLPSRRLDAGCRRNVTRNPIT